MRIIVTTCYNPIYNAENEIEIELDDDTTPEEIEKAVEEAAHEDFDWSWKKMEE